MSEFGLLKHDLGKVLRSWGIKDGIHSFHAQEATSPNDITLFPAPRINLFNRGVIMGTNRIPSSAFQLSLWDYYGQSGITSYSMVVFGKIGQRKSTFVKTYALRHNILGVPLYVLDPKGEYGALAKNLGLAYIDPRTDGINPFTHIPGYNTHETVDQRSRVLMALLNIYADRPLPSFIQHIIRGMNAKLEHNDAPVLDDYISLANSGQFSISQDLDPVPIFKYLPEIQHLLVLIREELGDVLNRRTNPHRLEQLSSKGIVVNLSPWLTEHQRLAAMLTATTEWLTPRLHSVGERKMLILDEAWSALAYEPFIEWLQMQLKLARQWTLSTILVVHDPANITSQSATDSRAEKIAQTLTGEFAAKVVFHLDEHAVAPLEKWGLNSWATDWISDSSVLLPGSAFIQLGPLWGILDSIVTDYELSIVDTDQSLTQSRAATVGS